MDTARKGGNIHSFFDGNVRAQRARDRALKKRRLEVEREAREAAHQATVQMKGERRRKRAQMRAREVRRIRFMLNQEKTAQLEERLALQERNENDNNSNDSTFLSDSDYDEEEEEDSA